MNKQIAEVKPWDDITALQHHKTRKKAIEAIMSGSCEKYLSWARTDGYLAAYGHEAPDPSSIDLHQPLPVDEALEKRIYAQGESAEERHQQYLLAYTLLPYFQLSPMEILLRNGNNEAIEKALATLCTPLRFFNIGYGQRHLLWVDRSERIKLIAPEFDELNQNRKKAVGQFSSTFAEELSFRIPLLKNFSSTDGMPLLLLPLLIGRFDVAATMQKHGLAPTSYSDYWELEDDLVETLKFIDKEPAAIQVLKALLDVDSTHIEAAATWLNNRGNLGQELEDLFDENNHHGSRKKIISLLEQGAPVGYFSLMVATEHNDLDMLNRLFAAGANPNDLYKTGVPALARINQTKLSPDALRIWLQAGASPIFGKENNRPYGDGMCPSPLSSALWEGNAVNVKMMVEEALQPTPLSFEAEGKRWAQLLALALYRGHHAIAKWMIREKGESLESLDQDHVKPVKAYASAEFLRDVQS